MESKFYACVYASFSFRTTIEESWGLAGTQEFEYFRFAIFLCGPNGAQMVHAVPAQTWTSYEHQLRQQCIKSLLHV